LIYRLPNIFKISNKITDARIDELQRLKDLKKELSDKIQTQKDDMQKILDTMDDEAQEVASSSSKAAKAARGIASSSLNHQDTIDALELTIGRLEEDYSGVERELEELEEAMNST
jgi:methyl-accepting chemotaxis protein